MSHKTTINLIPISELKGNNFYIPDYQRGYRWTSQQVKDLLEDIWEFMKKPNKTNFEIYCVQPLVVKKQYSEDGKALKDISNAESVEEIEEILENLKFKWEVIDGQQRLTTIHILLSYLQSSERLPVGNLYNLEYQTRSNSNMPDKNSKLFLNEIASKSEQEARNSIDFFHMYNAFKTIKIWFEGDENEQPVFNGNIKNFCETLLQKVNFIWYETHEQNPIKVFTRLNIGKISLTDSELIKALFLNRNNILSVEHNETISIIQKEIAAEWDEIEYTLQNEEFWYFIHDVGYTNPTRIDYIFEILRHKDSFKIGNKFENEDHGVFRYFDKGFKTRFDSFFIDNNYSDDSLRIVWREVKNIYQIFKEWYNDLELYHYIGFIVSATAYQSNKKQRDLALAGLLPELIDLWQKEGNKDEFLLSLKKRIVDIIRPCSDLGRTYGDNGEEKTECRPILLLHNIQTVISQNEEYAKSDKFKLKAFYKFPFHLFKKEAHKKNQRYGWEVEHISSNSGDDYSTKPNQIIYLLGAQNVVTDTSLLKRINLWLNNQSEESFEDIKQDIDKLEELIDNKNSIWNFTLLDSSTNQEYQNDVFPIKRICVISKDQGKKTKVIYDTENNLVRYETQPGTAFVPPCTKNVFMKYYTHTPQGFKSWTKEDAISYKANIELVLQEFLPSYYRVKNFFLKKINVSERSQLLTILESAECKYSLKELSSLGIDWDQMSDYISHNDIKPFDTFRSKAMIRYSLMKLNKLNIK